jgi:hypothetical protein
LEGKTEAGDAKHQMTGINMARKIQIIDFLIMGKHNILILKFKQDQAT